MRDQLAALRYEPQDHRLAALRDELRELRRLISLTKRATKDEQAGVAWKLSLRGLESRHAQLLQEQDALVRELQEVQEHTRWLSIEMLTEGIGRALEKALSQGALDASDVLVLAMHSIEERTLDEIAGVMQVSRSTVQRRLNRTRDVLRQFVG